MTGTTDESSLDRIMPVAPSFTEEDWQRAERTNDFMPILFEWYRFVGGLVVVMTNIKRDSPAYRQISATDYHVLVGHLNRCARLMLSNIALSHEGRFGETTAIVDRCIFEAAVKIIWLCSDPNKEKFARYFATGLKAELEFRSEIERNIAGRGHTLSIERRMLESIGRHVAASGLSEQQVLTTKKMLPLDAMMREIGLDRLHYIVAQRIGSHHVHGNWSSLLFHYLEEVSSEPWSFRPRDHNCPTHINQFMYVSQIVIEAMKSYAEFAFAAPEATTFVGLFESTAAQIMEHYEHAVKVDERHRDDGGDP